MVQINFAQKSVTVKIVYYGPGMSGKTTNLEIVHQRAPESNKGDLTSISTDGDRTLFFDFMPLDLGTVGGMRTQFQIYTVPGQVYYNSTRKLVLQGVDGVIFVADSSASMVEENLESLRNLEENLIEYGKNIDEIPLIIQYNKRDLPDALPVEQLEASLNRWGAPSFEAIANSGQGVFPTLKALAARVLDTIHEQTGGAGRGAPRTAAPKAPAAAPKAAATPPAAQQNVAPAAPLPGVPTAAPSSVHAHMPAAPRFQQPAPAAPQRPQPAAPKAPAAQRAAAPTPQQAPAQSKGPKPVAPLSFGQTQHGLRLADTGMRPKPTPPSRPAAPHAAVPQTQATRTPEPEMQTSQAPAPQAVPHRAPQRAPQRAQAPQPANHRAPMPPTVSRSAPSAAQHAAAQHAAHAPAPTPNGGQSARLRPRVAAAPTPVSRGKSSLVTGAIIIVALIAGIAIGGAVFKLL